MSLNLSDFYTDKNKDRRIISVPKFLDAYRRSDDREGFRIKFGHEILKREKLTTYDIDILNIIGFKYVAEKDIKDLHPRYAQSIKQFNGHSYAVSLMFNPRRDIDVMEWPSVLEACSQLEEKYLGKDEKKILFCLLLNNTYHGRLKFKTKYDEKDFISEFKEFVLDKRLLTIEEFTVSFFDNVDSLYKKNIHSLYQFIKKS